MKTRPTLESCVTFGQGTQVIPALEAAFQRGVLSGPHKENRKKKEELGLVEAYVDIDLRVLRIAAALVVDLKVGFIGPAAAKL